MAEGKSENSGTGSGGRTETSLGTFLTQARKNGGYTPEQVAAETRIPAHYVRAIENDDYGMISDQLYLLPFLRRYAAFIGLDPEDVASRFVHEVQRAETSSAKASEPIPMITNDRKPGRGRYMIVILLLLAIAAVTAFAIMNRQILLQHVLHFSKGTVEVAEPAPSTAPTAVPQREAADGAAAVPFESSVTPAPSGDAPSPSAPAKASSDFED